MNLQVLAQATVGKWGKSLAVRLNPNGAEAIGIKQGDKVKVEYYKNKIIIKAVK